MGWRDLASFGDITFEKSPEGSKEVKSQDHLKEEHPRENTKCKDPWGEHLID